MFAESLIFFVIHFIIFLLVIFVYLFNGYELSINWFGLALLPFVILYISLLSVFLGMIISCWGARYRDLLQIGSYGSQLLFYGTPIIYSMKSVPEKTQIKLTNWSGYIRFLRLKIERLEKII